MAGLARLSSGLGTRLSDMGMSTTTTLAFYMFPNPDKTKAGLKKLAETVRKTYKVKV
jgi:hypothetical protein